MRGSTGYAAREPWLIKDGFIAFAICLFMP